MVSLYIHFLHRFLFIFLLTLLSFSINGQEIDSLRVPDFGFSTRLGLNSFKEINIQFEKHIARRGGIELNFGYNFGVNLLDNDFFLCSFEPILIATRKQGIILKFGGVIYDAPRGSGKTVSILLDYRNSYIDRLIIDEGCSSGSSDSPYEEFDWSTHDLGIMVYRNKTGNKSKAFNFYLGAGMGIRYETKEYLFEGVFNSKRPSDRVSNLVNGVLRLDMGIRIKGMRYKYIQLKEKKKRAYLFGNG